ncbi:hypothetical protein GTY88_10730 [Streptomyces sp. SID5926]|nr:hypothetical protein [Streptomyces sp. SID5926]
MARLRAAARCRRPARRARPDHAGGLCVPSSAGHRPPDDHDERARTTGVVRALSGISPCQVRSTDKQAELTC